MCVRAREKLTGGKVDGALCDCSLFTHKIELQEDDKTRPTDRHLTFPSKSNF